MGDPERIEITTANRGDKADLLELIARQLDEHRLTPDRGRLAAAIDAILDDRGRGFFLIAREGTRAVGVAYGARVWSLEHGGESIWLDELYVLPGMRGRGIGGRILDRFLDAASRAGFPAADLEVDAEHARAEGLYERNGFTRLARSRWVRPLERGIE